MRYKLVDAITDPFTLAREMTARMRVFGGTRGWRLWYWLSAPFDAAYPLNAYYCAHAFLSCYGVVNPFVYSLHLLDVCLRHAMLKGIMEVSAA